MAILENVGYTEVLFSFTIISIIFRFSALIFDLPLVFPPLVQQLKEIPTANRFVTCTGPCCDSANQQLVLLLSTHPWYIEDPEIYPEILSRRNLDP